MLFVQAVKNSLGIEPSGSHGISDAEKWFHLGKFPVFCPACSQAQHLFGASNESDPARGTVLVCRTCKATIRSTDAAMDDRRLIHDYWRKAHQRLFDLELKPSPISSVQGTPLPPSSATPSNESSHSLSASNNSLPSKSRFGASFVPEEYAHTDLMVICWLKKYEAELILQAYQEGKNKRIRSANNVLIASALWYTEDSERPKKFGTEARVELVRHVGGSAVSVAWIYEYVAEAALEAIETNVGVELFDENETLVGAFPYFGDDSEEHSKHKAHVCVLRDPTYAQ